MSDEKGLIKREPGMISEWKIMREQANTLLKSGFLPTAIKTPEQAISIMLMGKELNIPPMQALRSIHVINGRPTLSAELTAALAFQKIPGLILNCTESTETKATYESQRPGGKLTTLSFTLDDAKALGLVGKDNWNKQPKTMLRHRACMAILRVVAPDAVMGIYTPEELGAPVDDEGKVIEGEVIDTEPERGGSPPPSEPPQPGSIPAPGPPPPPETPKGLDQLTKNKNYIWNLLMDIYAGNEDVALSELTRITVNTDKKGKKWPGLKSLDQIKTVEQSWAIVYKVKEHYKNEMGRDPIEP